VEITEIRRTKRERISVYIDGVFACVLHPEVYAVADIGVGRQVEPEALDEALRASRDKFAREYALNLLAQRSYTAKSLRDKLTAKVEDEEIADTVVARMEELGLIDDADYARRFAADCLNRRGFSLPRTARALREKGIDREIIDETLSRIEYDPQPAIAQIVRRKYLRYLEDEKGMRNTIAALQRLGYRFDDIRAVLQNLAEDENYYDYE